MPRGAGVSRHGGPATPVRVAGHFARGFLRGHQWLEELWNVELPEDVDEEFHATFMALTFFASRQTA